MLYVGGMRSPHNTLNQLARPSFAEGMARILDIGITLQKYDAVAMARDTDSRPMLCDWMVTGDDLRVSIETYDHRIRETSAR